MPIRTLIAVALIGCALPAAPILSQVASNPSGLVLGVGVAGIAVDADFGIGNGTEFGVGYHLEAGLGVSRGLIAFVRYSSALIDSDVNYTMGQLDAGVRYLFLGSASQLRPFLEAGVARRRLTQVNVITDSAIPDDARATSLGVLGGAGINYFVNPRLAVDAAVTIAPGTFEDWTARGQAIAIPGVDAVSYGIRLGVRVWPTNREN